MSGLGDIALRLPQMQHRQPSTPYAVYDEDGKVGPAATIGSSTIWSNARMPQPQHWREHKAPEPVRSSRPDGKATRSAVRDALAARLMAYPSTFGR